MIKFHYENNVIIEWNEDKIFNVFRDEVLINSFEEQETPTPKKAELIADEWLADVLQDELLDHADIYTIDPDDFDGDGEIKLEPDDIEPSEEEIWNFLNAREEKNA
tara:strand:- start:472 stop:789 length:318 start_codon:yes stop_codon:yes gene_type:complete